MALRTPKTLFLHAILANVSSELTTVDDIIRSPSRLPTELLLIIRAHLLVNLTNHFFKQSIDALANYEDELQSLLCPDCISYNHDIYGPDIWQWQQFSGPCSCIQTPFRTPPKPSTSPQQFVNPHHWLEHHLSLQFARLSADPSLTLSVWDMATHVLNRHHCELLREDQDDFSVIQGSAPTPSNINDIYYRRMINYYGTLKQSRTPPIVHIYPLQSSLRLLESKGVGEAGARGDTFRADIILRHASRDLGLALELKDVFSSPREPPAHSSWTPRKFGTSDVPIHKPIVLHYATSPVLSGAVRTWSFLSAVLTTCVSMPMTIATLALTIVCFYSRPIALRVGV